MYSKIFFHFCCRIVRNKAAEKAKHAHQVATSNATASATGGPVSVIAHAPATQIPEPRSGAYSINGILGLQHDPNGNSIKRKRIDDHGKSIFLSLLILIIKYRHLPIFKCINSHRASLKQNRFNLKLLT